MSKAKIGKKKWESGKKETQKQNSPGWGRGYFADWYKGYLSGLQCIG